MSIRVFCIPQGFVHSVKQEKKKLYKIRVERDFSETCNKLSKKYKLPVMIKILSLGLSAPEKGYIHVSDYAKIYMKSDV